MFEIQEIGTFYFVITGHFLLQVDVGTVTDASTVTEPEMLGPCEPGTPVNLDGIVWHETDTGMGCWPVKKWPAFWPVKV